MSRLKLRSVFPTGSLTISGSITATQFIDNAGNPVITSAQTSSFTSGIGNLSAETGSYLVTGSVSGNILTFEKKDGTTFNLTVDTGSGGGGGSTDISDLNTFTGSAETRLDNLEAATASFLIGEDTGSLLATASVVNNVITLEKADGTTFNLTVVTGSSEVYTAGLGIIISGNVVTLDTGSTHFITGVSQSAASSGFGSGNVAFGDPPTIDQDGFQVKEFETIGTTVGTLTVTDVTPGDSATFATQSSYSAGFFGIDSGSGVITNLVQTTASMNTSAGSGSNLAHPFLVKVTDSQNNIVNGTIYIYVEPNTAPVWRQTSTEGSIVTSFTQSLNENSVSGSNKARVFFTDAQGDTITISTGSLSETFTDTFSLTVESTYVQLNQITASLDFEATPTYEFVLTASDEHYENSDDTESITYLPFQVRVTDNTGPSVNDQTLSTINENSSDGASVGSITASDPEGDTIIFSNFSLVRAYVNGVGTNVTGSMGGTSLNDPTANAFTTDINGNVTRRNSVYLNADVADRYEYRVTVTDAFNTTTDTGLITIPIADDAASSITDNWTDVYVIESAVDGDSLYTNSNGLTGTVAQWSSAASQRWEVSSDSDLIEVTALTGSSTQLRVKNDISGSIYSYDGTNTINVALTASEHGFETTKQYVDLVVNVAINNAPQMGPTDASANQNTNGARSGSLLTTITISDLESDTIDHSSFTFVDSSGQLNAIKSGDDYLVQAVNNLSASLYQFTASIKDEHRFRTRTLEHSFNIAQAGIGTLGGDTTSYIIESAVSGAVLRDATGYNSGNPSQLTVSYSPQYSSAAVQSFTSSNAAIAVDSSGNLTLNTNLSGSTTGSGDTISSDITFQDQYGNLGSGSLTVNVFANQAPTATFTNQTANFETDLAIAGAAMVSMSISDTESDTPFSASLSGSGIADLEIVFANANSSSAAIKATDSLSAGTYNYHVTVFDNFGKSRIYSDRSFTVTQSPDYGKVYVYNVGFNNSTYNTAVGIQSEDSSTPPVATPYSNLGFVDAINRLGSSSFDYTYGSTITATLLASGSDTSVHDALRGMGSSGTIARNSSIHFVILMPSGSDLGGVPISVTDSYGGSAVGEYVLEVGTDGTTIDGSNTIEASEINQFDLATDHLGYTTWFMVGARNQVASSTSFNLGLNPSSGSGGA